MSLYFQHLVQALYLNRIFSKEKDKNLFFDKIQLHVLNQNRVCL
jgi:hypothetical protein